jgi:hypothetical protein
LKVWKNYISLLGAGREIATFVDLISSLDCRLRAELNAVLESSKTKDTPPKKISLNDFVIKVSIFFLHLGPYPSKQR